MHDRHPKQACDDRGIWQERIGLMVTELRQQAMIPYVLEEALRMVPRSAFLPPSRVRTRTILPSTALPEPCLNIPLLDAESNWYPCILPQPLRGGPSTVSSHQSHLDTERCCQEWLIVFKIDRTLWRLSMADVIQRLHADTCLHKNPS